MAKAKREQYLVLMNVAASGATTPEYEALGKDNEDMSQTLNNEVNATKNVLGQTSVEVTKGNQTTSVDPFKMDDTSKIATILHDIFVNEKELSDVEHEFIQVFLNKPVAESEGEYEAFQQIGAIDLKSYGGDTTGISAPFDINWLGERIFGTFNPTTKTFKANVA